MGILAKFKNRMKSNAALRMNLAQLRESEEKYRLIMQYAPLGVIHFDSDGLITTCNNNFIKIIGSSYEALVGLNMLNLPNQEIVAAVRGALDGLLTDYIGDYHSVTADKVTPVRVLFAPLISKSGLVTGGVGLVEDISKQKKAEEESEKSEAKYREILETIEDGYYEVNLAGKIMACNEAAARMLGYSVSELVGKRYSYLCRDKTAVFKAFNEAFRTGEPQFSITVEMVRKDASRLFAELSLSLTRNKNGKIIGFRGLGRDITERINFEKQLRYLSFHDQLTGLYNRLYFENEINRLCGSRSYPISIIAIDVDDLKLVNDTMGHASGDILLKACAGVVKDSLRNSDILARIGGDEFVVLLPLTAAETGKEIIGRILETVGIYNRDNSKPVLSISIGLSTAEDNQMPLKEALKIADDLMYRDKYNKESLSG